jgi:hypothetical protein
VKDVYGEGRVMYSGVGVDEELLEAIKGDERVWYVECAVVLRDDYGRMKWVWRWRVEELGELAVEGSIFGKALRYKLELSRLHISPSGVTA